MKNVEYGKYILRKTNAAEKAFLSWLRFNGLSGSYSPWVGRPPSPQVIRSSKAA